MGNAVVFVDDNGSNRLWRAIVKHDMWLKKAISFGAELVLVGAHIDAVGAQTAERKPVSMIIHANELLDDTLGFMYRTLSENHHYNKRRRKMIFPKTSWKDSADRKITIPRIILNARGVVQGAETLEPGKKSLLKTFQKRTFSSKFSFYTSPQIYTLKSSDTVGIGGPYPSLATLHQFVSSMSSHLPKNGRL